MRSVFASLYWALLLALLLAGAGLIWVLATPAGSKWAVDRLLAEYDIGLSVEAFSGTFLRGFSAEKIDYANKAFAIHLARVKSRYSLSALLDKKFHIETLQAEQVDIDIKPRENSPSRSGFQSPLAVLINALRIDTLTVRMNHKDLVFSDNQATGLRLQGNQLTFGELKSRFLQLHYDIAGGLRFTRPLSLDVTGQITTPQLPRPVQAAIQGDLDNYAIAATTRINKKALPDVRIAVNGEGNLSGIDIHSLLADLLDGEIQGKGHIGWRQGVRGELTFHGNKLNPGALHADFPGSLETRGTLALEGKTLSGKIALTGSVRNYPVKLDATANWKDGVLALPRTRLEIENNRLDLRGKIYPGNIAVLDASVAAANLAAAVPGLEGSLSGNGKITGPLTHPVFTAQLSARDLAWETFSAADAKLTIEPGIFSGEYAGSVEAGKLALGAQTIEQADISGLFSLQRQRGTLHINNGPLETKVAARLRGEWNGKEKRWNGEIQAMELSNRFLKKHVLRQPAAIEISSNGKKLSPLCLERAREKICLDGDIDRTGNAQASLSVAGVALTRLKPWLPEAASLKETIDATFKITGKDNVYHGAGKATLDQADYLETTLDLDLEHQSIKGTARAKFQRMEWLGFFNDDILSPRGKLAADIQFDGPLEKPAVSGEIALRDGFARLPRLGIELRDMALTSQIKPEKSASFTGSAQSGDGKVSLQGSIDWAHYPEWWMTLDATGEDFLASNLPEATVAVSPRLKIAASRHGIGVSGEVTVPKASISLGNLRASGVTPTQDEIILGEPRPGDEVPWPFIANIKLILGDAVNINGFGLKSRLGGELIISQRSDTAVDADGVIRLLEGEYKAYGQQLKIEKGDLYFNGPLKAPRLSVRAIRDIADDNVKVGLELRGTLQQPESSVFSVPAMEETDALAYLLTGKPLSGLGQQDSNLLLNAAVRLGLKSSAGSLDKLRKHAGLDTFAIQPGQDITDSALILGKFLTPRLYIQYATKLFTQSESFLLKYRLSSKLHLEAESGDDNQSMDLIYELETR